MCWGKEKKIQKRIKISAIRDTALPSLLPQLSLSWDNGQSQVLSFPCQDQASAQLRVHLSPWPCLKYSIQWLRLIAEGWAHQLSQTRDSLELRTVVWHIAGVLLQLLPLDIHSSLKPLPLAIFSCLFNFLLALRWLDVCVQSNKAGELFS